MKQVLTLGLFLSLVFPAVSQQVERCGIRQYNEKKIEENYSYQRAIDHAEMKAQKWISEQRGSLKAAGDRLVVPVVFHVVYHKDSARQNLDESIILQQLEVLNRDWNRGNKDSVNTRPIFDSIATDTKIVFELASVDPDGNPTNGITRTATEVQGFDLLPLGSGLAELDDIKSTANGGIDAWDTDKYLNIWIGRLTVFGGEGLYGIATFPLDMPENEGGDPDAEANLQGTIVHFPTVGYTKVGEDTVSRGRTLSHEVGHYFGLRHVWADEQNPWTGAPGNCEQDDFVYDTPMAAASANFECNTNVNYCSNENEFSNDYWGQVNPPDMIENFMDYASEDCQNMLSHGQAERSHAFLETSRKNLWFQNVNGSEPTDFKAWLYTENASVPCAENCDGQIIVNYENESGNLSYLLDGNPVSGPIISDVCQGIHTVTVSDDSGNSKTLRTYVSGIYSAPEFDATPTDASCSNCEDGSATVNISSGNEPFTVTWQTTPPVEGETLSDIAPGMYYYTVTDGCGESYMDSVRVANTTGIATLDASAFQVFPNPTENELRIKSPYLNRLSSVQLFDVSGRKVFEMELSERKQDLQLNLAPYAKGIYHLNLVDKEGNNKSYKLQKQ